MLKSVKGLTGDVCDKGEAGRESELLDETAPCCSAGEMLQEKKAGAVTQASGWQQARDVHYLSREYIGRDAERSSAACFFGFLSFLPC